MSFRCTDGLSAAMVGTTYLCVTLCAAQASGKVCVDLVLTKMVKVWGVLEFYFLEW